MKVAGAGKPEIIDSTAEFWNRRTGGSVSDEDARQMIRSIAGFFSVLDEWDRRARESKQAQPNGEAVP